MRLSLCLLLCRPLSKLLAWFRYWKNALIAVLFTSFAITIIVQKYVAISRLHLLLEYDFAEAPTRHPSYIARTRPLSDTEKVNTNSSMDDRIDCFEPSKCSRRIASLPKYSQWFRERFKSNIKLFLDELDRDNLSNLSFYELPFGFKDENHTLISSILHPSIFKNTPLRLRQKRICISCAVVGSGGILNGSRAGREIDAHDLVFRLNTAVTDGGYAADVGSRTDFYMFFPESAHLTNVRDQNVTLLYTMYKSFDVFYVAQILKGSRQSRRMKANAERIKIIHPDFFRYAFAKFLDGKSMKPTTGAVVVLLAIHLCDSVTIYGFGYDSNYSMHYYDQKFTKRTYKSTWTHDVDNEKRLWDRLHHEGIIRFFKRDVMR